MRSGPAGGLIGRERELAVGRERLESAALGSAGVVLVEGEAGIGKSAVVDAYEELATSMGIAVVKAGARPLGRHRPFGVLVDALELRSRSPDPRRERIGRLVLGRDGRREGSSDLDTRARVVNDIVDLLEDMSTASPLVLVLEDLHWADESTLAAVAATVDRLRHVPLVVVMTCRPAPRSSVLDALWEICIAAGADVCRLPPLASEHVDVLVRRQLGADSGALLAAIVERAGGNPLLLVELLRALVAEGWLTRAGGVVDATADELPSTLRDLVLRRLHYLPSQTLNLLQIASVLGDSVSIRDLAVVSQQPTSQVISELAEAFRAKLLDDGERGVVFRHQLVQQAIYEALPVAVRTTLHRHAADLLAAAGADAATVASHLLVGAERGDEQAVAWLRRAAGEAAASTPSVAVDLLQRAAGLLKAGDGAADIVTAELAAALLRAGKVAEAAELAAGILDRPHDPQLDLSLHLTLVDALGPQQRVPELIDRAAAALEARTLAPAERALVLAQASYGQIFSGELASGETTAARALAVAEAAESREMSCWALCALSIATKTQGRYVEALGTASRAAALADTDTSARRRHPNFFLAMALTDNDMLDEARAAYARAIDDAERLGAASLLPEMLLQQAELGFITGQWDDASVELEAGVSLALQQGQRIAVPQSRGYLALISLARGDSSAARRSLESNDDESSADGLIYGDELVAFAAAAIAEAEGDTSGALQLLLRAWRYDVDHDVRYWDRYLGPALVRLAIAGGHRDLAVEAHDRLESGRRLAPGVRSVQAAALRCHGLLEGDPDPLRRAVEICRGVGRVLDLAGSCEDAADVLARCGSTAEAIRLLEDAIVGYEQLDATANIARVNAALRNLGVRRGARGPRQRRQVGWDALTRSERAVSELVAEGHTNREVARRLHVSSHTVNTHLRHVFQKLGVSNRTELAARIAKIAENRPDHPIE